MKIGGILDLSTVDYPGKAAAVIFLHGCNFRCPFCFNHELVLGSKYAERSEEEIASHISKFKEFIEGVVITGGEPTLQPEELEKLCKKLKALKLLIKLDTNGTNPEAVKKLIDSRLIDFVALDVKAPFNVKDYSRVAGVKPADAREFLKKIRATLKILMNSSVSYECRCPIVPGLNDAMLKKLADDVKEANCFVLEQFLNEKTLDPKLLQIAGYPREKMIDFAKQFKNKTVKIRTRENGEELVTT